MISQESAQIAVPWREKQLHLVPSSFFHSITTSHWHISLTIGCINISLFHESIPVFVLYYREMIP